MDKGQSYDCVILKLRHVIFQFSSEPSERAEIGIWNYSDTVVHFTIGSLCSQLQPHSSKSAFDSVAKYREGITNIVDLRAVNYVSRVTFNMGILCTGDINGELINWIFNA